MNTQDSLQRNAGGFLLMPDFSFGLLTTDLVAPFAVDLGLPSTAFLTAARNCREIFLKTSPWTLQTSSSQATTRHWIAAMGKHLKNADALLFATWLTEVAPMVNFWQPLIESWLGIVERHAAGQLGSASAPTPVDHVAALISNVTDRPDWEELSVASEWDRMVARVYGTEEGDPADLVLHFDRIVATVGHRYLWSWAAERFGTGIDWKELTRWGAVHLPKPIAERSREVDLAKVLPLPKDLYAALKVAANK